MAYKHLGLMIDCSRNAVLKLETVKKYIDILERLGFNTLMLYTEDTFEVNNQPYFGYLRGKYSKEELKEIDSYAKKHNIELIPCIQTLAHLNAIVRWKEYKDYTDINDILLAGDERTYKLIEDIFETLEECFTSRTVNIGMDEAHMVGLGKYLKKNGYKNRFDILLNHLNRVYEIARNHGFKALMWSDMFFRLANKGNYYSENVNFDKSITRLVPKDLGLIYWDYYGVEKKHYENMIKAHKQFDNDIWFAGGLWCWNGFAPRNRFAIETLKASIQIIENNNIENVFFTLWGDDGKECSNFSVLPSLYYVSCLVRGITDERIIKEGFLKEFQIEFDEFMLLDLPNTTDNKPASNFNPEKYMFYNDCFCGIFDCTVSDDFVPKYDICAEKLDKLCDNKDFGYLFKNYKFLCDFLQIKYTIGKRTRQIYRSKDLNAIKQLAEKDYSKMLEYLEAFYKTFKDLWFYENKPYGFDVQEIRIGGLLKRIESCRQRLLDFAEGKIDAIDELEEDILPEFKDKYFYFNDWAKNVTVNVISHETH
ncbi:MAG: beta-N-acetylhexosaminidase [Clostridia bacterium]|nr:beta-N-acetylhexosaminidase [Clostridia bacterium]